MRATSKRLCRIASMARSNSTLSGCFDPTLASGLTDFLLVQATVIASKIPSTGISDLRPDKCDIKTSKSLFEMLVQNVYVGQPPSAVRRSKRGFFLSAAAPKPSASPLPKPPSAAPPHSSLDPHYRTRRCPPPKFPRPRAPHRPRRRVPPRRLLRCGRSARVGCESPLIAAFCAAWPE